MNTRRFTMEPRSWYAMQLLGDFFESDTIGYSPIRIHRITPMKTGEGRFELEFFHANYPAGVQDKHYTLQTIRRGEKTLLAVSQEHDPPRFLYLTDITFDWLRRNFPHAQLSGDSVQQALDRMYSK